MSEESIKDYIEIEGIKIYREEILQWKDYHMHNWGNISKENEQELSKIIISDILKEKQKQR
jgi:hypothetical protein